MTKTKAQKHLNYAIEHRKFWREKYVQNERDKCSTLDIKLSYYDATIREERRREVIQEIKEANERISRFQRIVL